MPYTFSSTGPVSSTSGGWPVSPQSSVSSMLRRILEELQTIRDAINGSTGVGSSTGVRGLDERVSDLEP